MAGIIKTAINRSRAEHLPIPKEIEQFGADGEEAVYRTLCESFDCVIRNVVVPHKKLYLEKDFMVVYKGIPFVLEVKNWKGEIGCKDGEFYQSKERCEKKMKSPVGTTRQFIDRMREFYGIATPICGMVVFCEPSCTLALPDEMDGIALLPLKKAVAYIKSQVKKVGKPVEELDPSRILRCTRFYSRDSEFCKGILADCYFTCKTAAGDVVRVDTTCLRYLSVESQPLRLRDKLLLTYVNGATDVFYNQDTVFTVGCLDGTYRKIALNRVRHIVF